MVHYLQHLQEFLQILSGEERHILDIVQADICSVGGCMVLSTIAHGNKITFLMRYRHIYIYIIFVSKGNVIAVHWIVSLYCTCFCSCPLLGMSFHVSPRRSMTFAHVMWKLVLHAWRSGASPAMPVHLHRRFWMSSFQLKAATCWFCHDCFFSASFSWATFFLGRGRNSQCNLNFEKSPLS